ncbi:tetratricopeptide repeat protein [Polyangium aurulentum]|uniref:tetratricopeptide repeat protein n=1 Tax=Polyangium aurulentum TaxID=2567896 RepID=UPI0010AE653C|nr:tetratricopeptide repeat protein [Polyangium aurulentum]UQA62110.1 tetratricopeptide repeat protein [Polyangium aurulentum]
MIKRGIAKHLGALIPACLLALSLAMPARAAEITAADQAAATALFDEARTLFDQGKFAEALAKFQAAQRLDPTAGKLLNIARCHDKLGQTASAWGALDEAEAMARKNGDEERRSYAEKWQKELEPKLSRMRIEIAPEAKNLVVLIDGKALPSGAIGSALPVDPGEHEVRAEEGGKITWRTKVRIEAAPNTTTVRVPAPAAGPKPLPPPPPPPFWSGQRVAGVAVGGVGIAGIVVGAVFGVQAAATLEQSNPHCKDLDPDPCDAEGVRLRDRSNREAWASNISIGVGAVAVAGGLVLFLTAPRGKSEPRQSGRLAVIPLAGTTGGGFSVQGSF